MPADLKAFACAVLAIAVSAVSASAAAQPAPNVKAELARIEKQTQHIRGLKQLRPVKAVFPSDKAFDAALSREMHLFNPESEIRIGQEEDVLLGLLSKKDSLHRIVFQSLGSQVIGFYGRRDKVLYVRRHSNRVFGVERWTIAHEYTHALQDQHYNLQRLIPDETKIHYRNSDVVAAHHALTEGDAVVTQILFRDETYSAAERKALLRLEQHPPRTPPVPKAIQRQFNFPYTTGVGFAAILYRSGGEHAIDAAYRRLPGSTYEIMHPDAYMRHWHPVSVALHHVTGFAGWKVVDDDVLGAFGYQALLWQYLSLGAASRITDAYSGDRYVFLTRGRAEAFLFKSDWSSPGRARAARDGLLAALRARFHHGRTAVSRSGTTFIGGGEAVFLRATGSGLSMAYAPSAKLAIKLGSAKTT